MQKTTIKKLALIACAFTLTSCSGFFDKDNTPIPRALTSYTPQVTPRMLWSTRAGSGTGGEYLKMSPAIGRLAVYTTSANGYVTSVCKANGRINWQINVCSAIASGPGVGNGIVVAAGRRGEVIALDESCGKIVWRTCITGEILAKPSVGNGIVIIKAVDGGLTALSAVDGHVLWTEQQTEPALILRGASAPIVRDGNIIAGFANGNLTKYTLRNGDLDWLQPVSIPQGAFAIERMIDVDADPIVYGHHIYAATYQGKIGSFDWSTGNTIWSNDISSYTGMAADNNMVYISDAKSYIWAFNASNGTMNWRQCALEARIVSSPAVMCNYIIVGDGQRYLHWLNARTGCLAAREKVCGPVYAAPVVENNIAYALTSDGTLYAYILR